MKTDKKNGCRERSISSTISYKLLSFLTTHLLLQSVFTTLLLLPALFSCNTIEPSGMEAIRATRMKMDSSSDKGEHHTMDIFTFNVEGAGHLDSYQHIESFSGQDLELRSQSGEKHVFVCSNGQRSIYDWAVINSRASLDGMFIELKEERRQSLCATGEAFVNAGEGMEYQIEMRSIASEIVLNSIKCDFSGKSYEGKKITDVSVYLTNVNCRCSLTADGEISPLSIVNASGADHDEMDGYAEKDMLFQNMEEDIGPEAMRVGMSFICYPNSCRKEGPGTPFTRLVIEGKIDGETFWWPVDINRQEGTGNLGIHRNSRYVFDINITRKGSSGPDEVLETDAAEIKMSVKAWTEKAEQEISF